MKIRSKLTLRYMLATAGVFSALAAAVILFAGHNREKEFFKTLRSEAVTKANLFLNGRVEPETMHGIYLNNREFINEVEVAVYGMDHELLYHDDTDIDIVKETPEMFREITALGSLEFYEGDYQVVGLVYDFSGRQYIVTAAAYDGYGHAQQRALAALVIILWLLGMVVIAVTGYMLAKSALRPLSRMVDEVEGITGSNLDKRLQVDNPGDELGELARTFNVMLDRLEKAFDNQKMFVSNISHELRTPLAALIAELELVLLRERPAQEYRQAVENSLSDARKIARLSSGLLDLARADYGPGQVALRHVRLDEVLLDARETVLKAKSDYRVDLLLDQTLEDEYTVTARGNEYLLKTAFVNLMENNCKFSGDRTSHVQVSSFGGKVILRFSDTGVGMEREEAGKIFAPFYRGANSGQTPGHGIGMALVQRILTLHGGKIEVNSHVAEGTVFICEIPHL